MVSLVRNIPLVLTALLVIFLSNASAENSKTNIRLSNDIISEFILTNPEIILESLKRYEEKLALTVKQRERILIKQELQALSFDRSSYIGGNPNGSITMIEFIDYKCGYCKKAHEQIAQLLLSNSEIRFIVKEFPILGDESELAARASIAVLLAEGNAVYWDFTDKLLNTNGRISIDLIKGLVKSVGGKSFNIEKKMASSEVYGILNSNFALARKIKITGTPTFIIGTEIYRGYKDIEALQKIINKRKQSL